MGIIELILMALALAMDAFAVSVCKGLATGKVKIKHMLTVGAWFGGFQALMPLIGYFLGSVFKNVLEAVDHWIAFGLLLFIGINMLIEAFSKKEEETCDNFGFKVMLTMAVATSIDALAVGISFGMLPEVNIVLAVSLIGVITFTLSAIGVKIGSVFGAKYKSVAEAVGGIVLIILGIKILIEHLFF